MPKRSLLALNLETEEERNERIRQTRNRAMRKYQTKRYNEDKEYQTYKKEHSNLYKKKYNIKTIYKPKVISEEQKEEIKEEKILNKQNKENIKLQRKILLSEKMKEARLQVKKQLLEQDKNNKLLIFNTLENENI